MAAAESAGAGARTGVIATDRAGPPTLHTTAPTGLVRITARAVVIATGTRKTPRSVPIPRTGNP
ncbi:hypothetical protein [Streptomyces sp. NPDC047985]|uniref:hypothetical protein n=1 Tax=Streptomyces sp. NPDC047985 TaxID=3155384 RepID=UPI0034254613